MNTVHDQRPRAKRVDNPEFHEVIVERIPETFGLGDPISERQDEGYEVVKEGSRRVTMRIPFAKHQEAMTQAWEIANSRLSARSAPDIVGGPIAAVSASNKVSQGLSGEELASGMPASPNSRDQ